ncbi:hypothetical protein GCK72_000559 [Caenorhabditis remanei]|uniref:Piwi domain-containing protein n=1 Tax=Caenorhabditis remanei TaxID=31234 RepID=A0A6A5HPZ8_CAERE|nr:hypothetical protein GCK72_000559 [Caenorhabditis remanei]KAF1768746.1 hypothetical protein GCK72_000559 [Caenorhabditis remanei]
MPSKSNKKKAAAERSAKLANEATEVAESAPTPTEPPPAAATTPSQPTPEMPKSSKPAPPKELVAPSNIAPLKKNKPLKVTTNSYQMEVKNVVCYRYDVKITGQADGRNQFLLTGSKGSDRQKQTELAEILTLAMKKENITQLYIYDGAATLHTPAQFNVKKNGASGTIITTIDSTELSSSLRNSYFSKTHGRFDVIVELNSAQPQLHSSDLLKESPDSTSCPVTQMIQIALCEEAKRNNFLITDGGNEMFDRAGVTQIRGVEDMNGVGAGIKIAMGVEGKPAAHLILDYKKKQFFANTPLTNLNLDWTNIPKVKNYLKGLKVSTKTNDRPQTFTIDGLSSLLMGQIKYDGGSVLQNAMRCTGKPASAFNTEIPAIESRQFSKREGKKKTFNFPIEILVLAPNQKLNPKHGNPPRCERPHKRFELTKTVGEKAHILSSNKILESFGVKIRPEPIVVDAVTVPIPTIQYKTSCTAPDLSKQAKWEVRGPFVEPATIGKILIVFNSTNPQDSDKLIQLKGQFAHTARDCGVTIREISTENLAQTYPGASVLLAIEKKFAELKSLPVAKKPLVIYADYSSSPTHGFLKLQERLCDVVTQQVSFDKSLSRPTIGRSTMINFMLKLNLKSGGLNHKVKPDPSIAHLYGDSSNTLFISYDVCHSSGILYRKGEVCDEPSCVGFGFNGTAHPEAIIGDFHYQLPRTEQVDDEVLKTRANFILTQYATARKKFPDQIVILRDGVSEGQHAMVVNDEFAAIKDGIMTCLKNNKQTKVPALALLIVTKRHANRLFVKDTQGISNVPPLTAIDQGIVRKNGNEVIFVSHCPLQGTAQPIVINMLHNEKVFKTNDELVQLMSVMCCAHQSSTTIVSLPETIYAADEYAKRGADIFQAYKSQPGVVLPTKVTEETGEQLDFLNITQTLCYFKSSFKGRRIA